MKTRLPRTALALAAGLALALPAAAQTDAEPEARIVTNPTVNLTLELASTRPVDAVTLLDMNGRPVFEGRPEGDRISVAGLTPGLYIAWLRMGKKVVTRRVRVG